MSLENPKKTESRPEQPQIPKNANEILGIKPGASPEEINKAWRTKVREFHPDKNPDQKNQEWIRAINTARDNLLQNRPSIRTETPQNEVKIKQWQKYVAEQQEEQRRKREEAKKKIELEEVRRKLREQEEIRDLGYKLREKLRGVNGMLENYHRFYNPVVALERELKDESKKFFTDKKKLAELRERLDKEKKILEKYQAEKVELENRLSQLGQ